MKGKGKCLYIPEKVEQHVYVIKTYKYKDERWSFTLTKDAIRILESGKFSSEIAMLNNLKNNV